MKKKHGVEFTTKDNNSILHLHIFGPPPGSMVCQLAVYCPIDP